MQNKITLHLLKVAIIKISPPTSENIQTVDVFPFLINIWDRACGQLTSTRLVPLFFFAILFLSQPYGTRWTLYRSVGQFLYIN